MRRRGVPPGGGLASELEDLLDGRGSGYTAGPSPITHGDGRGTPASSAATKVPQMAVRGTLDGGAYGNGFSSSFGGSSSAHATSDQAPGREGEDQASGLRGVNLPGRTTNTVLILSLIGADVFAIWYYWGFLLCVSFLCLLGILVGVRESGKVKRKHVHRLGMAVVLFPAIFWVLAIFLQLASGFFSLVMALFNDFSSNLAFQRASAVGSGDVPPNTFSSTASSSVSAAVGSSDKMVVKRVPVYATAGNDEVLSIQCPRGGRVVSVDFASYGLPSSCRGWKQTGGCSATGPRENTSDLACDVRVPTQASGYCECADGTRRAESGCKHASFTCEEECSKVVRCIGWRGTANCDPHNGAKMNTLLSCTTIVPMQVSGYCECSTGKVAMSGCDHDLFTCEDMCTAGTPRWPPVAVSPSCHSPTSQAVVEDHCIGRTACAVTAGWPFGEDPCPGDVRPRKLHVRVSCELKVRRPRAGTTIGEICKPRTDALKSCLSHHLIADATKCSEQFERVVKCQSDARDIAGRPTEPVL